MQIIVRYPGRGFAHLSGGQTGGSDHCLLLGYSHVHLYNSKSAPLNRDAVAASALSASALKRIIHNFGIWTSPDPLSRESFF